MNDIAPSDALIALRERARELHHERDLIDARLAEVADMIELIETPKRRPRQPRTVRAGDTVLDYTTAPLEDSAPAS